MKARPILFSAPMVRALLDGRKTQTRRIIKPLKGEEIDPDGIYTYHPGDHELARCPCGKFGDLLWVREAHAKVMVGGGMGYVPGDQIIYRADGDDEGIKWKPSIHMPRAVSRVTLEIAAVRVQKLRRISEMDAYAEGVDTEGDAYIAAEHGKLGGAQGPAASVCAYADLWDSINGPGSWDANPWVWAISFCVYKGNVDVLLKSREAA